MINYQKIELESSHKIPFIDKSDDKTTSKAIGT